MEQIDWCKCGCGKRAKPGREYLWGHKDKPRVNKTGIVRERGSRKGHRHPNWQGGKTKEPYCNEWYDPDFKKMIFERDNYRCQNPLCRECGIGKIVRHHIDGNKLNCHLDNIILLCTSCSGVVEGRRKHGRPREWWQTLLEEIIKTKKIAYNVKSLAI